MLLEADRSLNLNMPESYAKRLRCHGSLSSNERRDSANVNGYRLFGGEATDWFDESREDSITSQHAA